MFSHAGLSQVVASTPPAKAVDPGQNHFWLSGSLSFLKDPSGQMSFEAVQAAYMRGNFEPTHNFAVNSGYTGNKPIWVHFTLDYPAGDVSVWWLLMAPDLLETITVYAEQPDGGYLMHEGGRSIPFDRREMEGIGHTFRFGRDPGGRRHYFIRITTEVAIKVEPSLWQERQLSRYLAGINATSGVYAGIVVLLILASLVRAVRFRNPWDIAYCCYITGFEMFNLTNAGLVQAWRLTDSVIIRQGLIQTGIFLSGVSFVALTRSLIFWPNNPLRWLRHWPTWGLGLLLMSLAAIAMFQPALFTEVNFNTAVALLGLSTLAGVWASWRNYPNARLMTLCFLPFVLWAVYVTIARWLESPIPDAWNRNRILMITSVLHLFALWLLILGKDARLERAKRQLEGQLSALRSEMSHLNLFMSMLGHELNRPLNALAALAQENPVCSGPVSESPQWSHLSVIHHEFSEILKTCTDQIRQAAVTQLDRRPVDLAGLLRGVAEHFQLKTTTHLIRSDTAELPTDFPCDPKLVSILLINLVENALRYSPEGGAVWVSGKQMNAGTIEISVTDEGPGIPASARERIFERYVQLNTTAPQQEGMGLGLFIVKRIAELHGGHVVCESEQGEGATFRVTLRAPE